MIWRIRASFATAFADHAVRLMSLVEFLTYHDASTWTTEQPGLEIEAAQWLWNKDVVALGRDNWAIEVKPTQDPDYPSTLHRVLCRGMRVPRGDHLEELADYRREDGVHEFFSGPPLRFTRALGSPGNPIAIKYIDRRNWAP